MWPHFFPWGLLGFNPHASHLTARVTRQPLMLPPSSGSCRMAFLTYPCFSHHPWQITKPSEHSLLEQNAALGLQAAPHLFLEGSVSPVALSGNCWVVCLAGGGRVIVLLPPQGRWETRPFTLSLRTLPLAPLPSGNAAPAPLLLC